MLRAAAVVIVLVLLQSRLVHRLTRAGGRAPATVAAVPPRKKSAIELEHSFPLIASIISTHTRP